MANQEEEEQQFDAAVSYTVYNKKKKGKVFVYGDIQVNTVVCVANKGQINRIRSNIRPFDWLIRFDNRTSTPNVQAHQPDNPLPLIDRLNERLCSDKNKGF